MSKHEWHFPRTEFAEQVFNLLVDGPAFAISLFGPRRTGKTEFLLEDLAPLADKKKHRVVYVSMWQTKDAPLASILYALDEALKGARLSDRLKSAATALAPKLKLKPPGSVAEMEIDISALRGKPQENHLLLLDQYCERLANAKRPSWLLFDEFQELAQSSDSAPIIAALRTSLDTRKRSLVSVFTGSSEEGLNKVFNAKDAPFFRFATQMKLPVLDEAFIDHQLGVFESKSKRKIDKETAVKAFASIEHNPLFFQKWLVALMVHSQLDAESAIDQVLKELGEQFGFQDMWSKLKPDQRAMMLILAERKMTAFSLQAIETLQVLTGDMMLTKSKLLSAVRRLSRLGVAEKLDEAWRLNDPLLEVWVKARPKTDYENTK